MKHEPDKLPSSAGRGAGNESEAPHGQVLVYQAEGGQLKIDVRLEEETVWLTQAHMAELFQTTVPNVSMHLRNVFAEGELQTVATVKEFLIVRQEGNRQVSRAVEHYNLDAIISVGYRVKSAVVGTLYSARSENGRAGFGMAESTAGFRCGTSDTIAELKLATICATVIQR